MARPPKYASEEDKPVSVTLRLPRNLYDQAQQHAKRRQTTSQSWCERVCSCGSTRGQIRAIFLQRRILL